MSPTVTRTEEKPTVSKELVRLLQHSSHYFTGLLCSLALGFISFPIYTRVFSVADYGSIDFIQRILLLCTAFSKLGIQNSALRFFNRTEFETHPGQAKKYYSTMFLGMAATSGVVTILFAFLVRLNPSSWIDSGIASLLYFTSGIIFLRALESILWSFLRIEERTRAYTGYQILIKGSTLVVICSILYFTGRSARHFFLGMIAVEGCIVAYMVYLLLRRGIIHLRCFDRRLFWSAISFGMPLIVYEIASIVLDSGDRVLVRKYLGADALGQYSVAYGLSSYVNDLMIVPLNLALLPIYMRMWNTEGVEKTSSFLSTAFNVFVIVAAGVFTLAYVGSHDAVRVLASSKYASQSGLIPIIVAGLLIYTTQVFLSAGLLIHKKTMAMARALFLSALLNVILNVILLPRVGLAGAAIATLVSYCFCILWLARDSFRVLPLSINIRTMGRAALASAITCALVSRIEIGIPIVSLAIRGALAAVLFAALMAGFDTKVRSMALGQWSKFRFRETAMPQVEATVAEG
jgi:O-antigen/teichoic acid export membrane protein